MTPRQVIKEVRLLRSQGKQLREISSILAEKGVVGPKSGKPISLGTLSSWLKSSDAQPLVAKTKRVGKATAHKTAYYKAVASVLNTDLEASEKIALAQLLLEASEK